MVETLLYYSKNREELISQILPYVVKDKLDSDMSDALFYYSSDHKDLNKRIDAMKNSV